MPRTAVNLAASCALALALALALGLAALPMAAKADVVFTSGPVNGTFGGYTMSSGTQMSAKFTLSQATNLTDVHFGAWLNLGAANPLSVDWSIGTSFFDGSLAAGTGALSGTLLSQAFGFYDVYDEAFSLGSVSLAAGTYYLTMTRADSPFEAMYWDIANYNYGPNAAQGYGGSLGGYALDVSFTIESNAAPNGVPEPASLAIAALGLIAGAAASRRRA